MIPRRHTMNLSKSWLPGRPPVGSGLSIEKAEMVDRISAGFLHYNNPLRQWQLL